MMDTLETMVCSTPIGNLELIANSTELVACCMTDQAVSTSPIRSLVLNAAYAQLQEYFEGKRKKFDIPLAKKGTVFQKAVWKKLQSIPYGKTKSYSEVAVQIKSPRGFRAVGTACGKNPWLIFVPCHRVVAQNGLGGFALSMEKKKWLIQHEL